MRRLQNRAKSVLALVRSMGRTRQLQAAALACVLVLAAAAAALLRFHDAPKAVPGVRATSDSLPQPVDMEAVKEDLAATPMLAAPDTQAVRETVFPMPTGDWADSLYVPPWVLRPELAFSTRRRYSYSGDLSPGSRPEKPAPSLNQRVTDSLGVALIARVQGSRVAVSPLGNATLSAQSLRAAGMLRILPACNADVLLEGAVSSTNRLSGRLAGPLGNWLFTLAVISRRCATLRVAGEPALSYSERSEILSALETQGSEGPPLHPVDQDLKEVFRFKLGDETVYAGVIRQASATQSWPPPVLQQYAFLLRQSRQARLGTRPLVWHMEIGDEGRLAFAGAYRDGDESVLVFVYQSRTALRVIRLVPGEGGEWKARPDTYLTAQ